MQPTGERWVWWCQDLDCFLQEEWKRFSILGACLQGNKGALDWQIGSDVDAVLIFIGNDRAEWKSEAVNLLGNLHSHPNQELWIVVSDLKTGPVDSSCRNGLRPNRGWVVPQWKVQELGHSGLVLNSTATPLLYIKRLRCFQHLTSIPTECLLGGMEVVAGVGEV